MSYGWGPQENPQYIIILATASYSIPLYHIGTKLLLANKCDVRLQSKTLFALFYMSALYRVTVQSCIKPLSTTSALKGLAPSSGP